MSDVDLSAEKYEKYREAGDILAQVLDEAADRVEVGASHLEVAEFAELTGSSAGVIVVDADGGTGSAFNSEAMQTGLASD